MHTLLTRVRENGIGGLLFEDAFTGGVPITRMEIVMMFLALLELLRQSKLNVEQHGPLAPIWITPTTEKPDEAEQL
jgi:chromatin segregation and condensation protein Rec8/ScpA/Scc1 (kleisin family)